MMTIAICTGILALLFWAANRYERHIRVWAKRYEPKVKLNDEEAKSVIESCDLIMEIHHDPQSDEYRKALETKLQLERSQRKNLPPLKRPLVFGDKEQIQAMKDADAKLEYDNLPACDECSGEPECSRCHRECESCDGTGKDQKALQEWRDKNPCRTCQ